MKLGIYIALLSLISFSSIARNNQTCDLQNVFDNVGYGPFDYTTTKGKQKLGVVEKAHFNRNVKNLVHGKSGADPLPDLIYVLSKFPNHHPALYSMSKLLRKRDANSTLRNNNKHYTARCYFERAKTFSSKDATVLALYGIHLHKSLKYTGAEKQYLNALQLAPHNPEINYNLGLLYIDMKEYTQAKHYADIAYEQGFPLPGLKNKLEKLASSAK
ncbi:tetratricopeptide repeat protein [Candidatus Colwellia aromaticivorans]|uniref:tetratricopeptide repeat protein n=1 Tax=Candidatus Colwellia aromaticivorans TaxID=2267621 RepID=UPI000DF41C97|nr:tetratricopeptide repeat protein [Candidatus Colwellia aromaticivorans]